MMTIQRPKSVLCPALALLLLALSTTAVAAEWAHWRGPTRNGVSPDIDLFEGWSEPGGQILWRSELVGRSTPVVHDGKVCANGRVGTEIERQEIVACFDAETGDRLWERRYNVYHTTVPWNRVGWANPTLDPETGYLYVQGVGGLFHCLDSATGETVWTRNLIEEFGFMEGYGGRTQTPLIDEDRVIVTFSSSGWGAIARPLHRLHAFDKRTGELTWISSPGNSLSDKNTQSTPSIAVINGQRLIIQGNGNGWIYAVKARTGEKVWEFQLSLRGINTSVLVDGTTVYAAHSEENIDDGLMARVVAIDATGTGNVTETHELWRAPLGVGFPSPTLLGDQLAVLTNSADLILLDKSTGEQRAELKIGRVGKGSPVAVGNRLLATEVNGVFTVVELHDGELETVASHDFRVEAEDRYAEIYASPAVAYGRVYVSTEGGLYAIGEPGRPMTEGPAASLALAEEAPPGSEAAHLQIVPAEIRVAPGDSATFTARAYDANGRYLGERTADWSLTGLEGTIGDDGSFSASAEAGSHAGLITASADGLEAQARARIIAPIPANEDFEAIEAGSRPSYQLGYVGRFQVEEGDGNKILVKGPSPRMIHRHITFLGDPAMSDYTVEADILAHRDGRKWGDVGLINSGYQMEIMGAHQYIEVRSWSAALRMAQQFDFSWDPGVWYRMKLEVRPLDEGVRIRGKVWPRAEDEPEAWNVEMVDPIGIRHGSPGLAGYSPAPVSYDNFKVTSN